jgi:hypothetical protein
MTDSKTEPKPSRSGPFLEECNALKALKLLLGSHIPLEVSAERNRSSEDAIHKDRLQAPPNTNPHSERPPLRTHIVN